MALSCTDVRAESVLSVTSGAGAPGPRTFPIRVTTVTDALLVRAYIPVYLHLSIQEHAKEGAVRVGIRLVKIAAIYLLIGVGLGLAMGISQNFALSSVHAHISLLGWATMSLAGIVYILVPGCDRSRLATWHFWGHNAGLPIMTVSLALETYGYKSADKAIGAGSILLLVSLLIFAINLYLNARAERPA